VNKWTVQVGDLSASWSVVRGLKCWRVEVKDKYSVIDGDISFLAKRYGDQFGRIGRHWDVWKPKGEVCVEKCVSH
jgi:hypothetical protein